MALVCNRLVPKQLAMAVDSDGKVARLRMSSDRCTTKRILPGMIAQGAGKLLYTASISGTMSTS
jgi:short-subunit dehydrogenase